MSAPTRKSLYRIGSRPIGPDGHQIKRALPSDLRRKWGINQAEIC
jgi:hypothetical protein